MGGSYNHLRDDETGKFTFDLIDNVGDAWEACWQCFGIIEILSGGDQALVQAAAAMVPHYTEDDL